MDQLRHLLVELASHMRKLCLSLDSTTDQAAKYRQLFHRLRAEFDVGIYNLNYDTAALAAWPDAYAGFSNTGIFEPRSVHERTEWGFVYHLHGSVHHTLDNRSGNEIRWMQDLNRKFNDGHQGFSRDKRSEGRSFPKTTLIVGGFKLDQLLVEPFHSFYATLARNIYAADAILIAGYGFGDVHINRTLRNRLMMWNQKPPIMVLDFANERTDPISLRNDAWAHQLSETVNVSPSLFLEPGNNSAIPPLELAKKGSFETSSIRPVALWYGGVGAATTRLDCIVPWLNGQPDDVLVG
jgi:hypothetical protein